ncbi:MAG TPA: NAD(P)/FAD-dependent oxidoreductase [Candidatus Acidoferrales bacterium]|nr:NAD(P)/FAD-dependent oxidoreductase [Candidatus Acidoferrales bacterium]
MNHDAEIAVVGAGFAGTGLAMQLLRRGYKDFLLLERAADVGGIWRDNLYPGCACDIPSMLYSFSFAPSRDWTRRFPSRDEIWEYLRARAREPELRSRLRLQAELREARFDDEDCSWQLKLADGSTLRTRFLVLATGALNRPKWPEIAGLECFTGARVHSSAWTERLEVRDRDVAVVGTGASAVQIVPEVARLARRLTVYQRTPAWVMPRGDRPVSALRRGARRWIPGFAAFERTAVYWSLEARAYGFVTNPDANALAERFALAHLRRQVADPELVRRLTPAYRLGCKRVLLSDDFYPALCRENVELVTDPIDRVRERSIVSAGVERRADAIVCATGFTATEPLAGVRVAGSRGRELAEAWSSGMHAYLGSSVAGFPNLFFIVGPNTGLGHNSMVLMMEAQYRYVLSALDAVHRRSARAIDVDAGVQSRFNAELQRRMDRTVWKTGCGSWYLDASGKNTTLWPGFSFAFAAATRHVHEDRYRFVR